MLQRVSLPVSLLRRLCFTTFASVCLIEGPHLAGLGALLHVRSLSLIANLPRLSVPFYVQVFFLPSCLLSACFYSSTVAHNKVIHNVGLPGSVPLAETDAVGKHSASTKDLLERFLCEKSSGTN